MTCIRLRMWKRCAWARRLNKAKIIFKYAGKNRWKFYVGLIFLLLTSITALAFPKFMGMLVDCVNKKDNHLANQIALGLGLVLILQSVFSFFRLSLFVNFTENTLANVRVALYTNLVKLPMSFFSQKRVGELNSRISNDIGQIQDTLTTTIAEFLRQFILQMGCQSGWNNFNYLNVKFILLNVVKQSDAATQNDWRNVNTKFIYQPCI